jgi:hypothetical protein
MNSRRYSNLMRKAATVAAIFLLLGQSIAAAHIHRFSARRELSASGASSVNDSACPICAAHLNSSATAPLVPALDAPTIATQLIPKALDQPPSSNFLQHRFGRAPPLSL